ncbi:MAG: hypothetical protein LBI17_00395 [Rickettsiales bacterium]|jgi:hypothetical protein|nr:hypothetical protein [Rickettsiales bacterium]
MKKSEDVSLFGKITLGRTVAGAAFLAAATLIAYVSISQMRMSEEQKRIDAQISEIKNEIFVRQCRLDKIYCCSGRGDDACARWSEQNCREDDGLDQIACNKK